MTDFQVTSRQLNLRYGSPGFGIGKGGKDDKLKGYKSPEWGLGHSEVTSWAIWMILAPRVAHSMPYRPFCASWWPPWFQLTSERPRQLE